MIKRIVKSYVTKRQSDINSLNRARLINKDISLICSNCAGGIIYHWLGLKFNSPFINLYMTGEDYIKALENWKDFLNTEIVEDTNSDETYPIGIGYLGIRIHFLHYATFEEAIEKWNQRKMRIKPDNQFFMFTNFGGGVDAIELYQRPIKWSFPGVEQAVLDVPELLAEVHIVPVGVLKALHLVPEGVHL